MKSMGKVSKYLLVIVVIGLAFVSYWIYARYIVKPEEQALSFIVERGVLQEKVTARGAVEALTSLDLEFPYSGTVVSVNGSDGQKVESGRVLMVLDTRDLEIERSRLGAVKLQAEAKLDKLLAGSSVESIKVADEQVASASALFEDARRYLIDKIRDAYVKTDDAVGSDTDLFFDNPKTSPKFIFDVIDQQAKINLEIERRDVAIMMSAWKLSIANIDSGNLLVKVAEAEKNVAQVVDYLNDLAGLINGLTTSSTLTEASIDTYRANVAAARTAVATVSAALVAGQEKLNTAEASLRVYQRQAESTRAPSRAEDVASARASIAEAVSQIASVEEKIRKSVIRAPADCVITKNWFERGEFYTVGQSAVSVSYSGYKVQTDVSELDIGKISSSGGEDVEIQLDAFPEEMFRGKVTLIESKPVLKDTDVYYRVVVAFPESTHSIRSGMSADVTILSEKKEGVLKVPELAVYKRGQEKFVYMSSEVGGEERLVKTGISDGTDIEIVSGLSEGEKIYIKPE